MVENRLLRMIYKQTEEVEGGDLVRNGKKIKVPREKES